jgi:hypothetical protein
MPIKEEIAQKVQVAIQALVDSAEGGDFEAIAWLLLTEDINLTPEQMSQIEKGLHTIIAVNLDIGSLPRIKALALYMRNATKF